MATQPQHLIAPHAADTRAGDGDGLLRTLWRDPQPGSSPALTASLRMTISAAAQARLDDLAQAAGVTRESAMAAAFRVLMFRQTGHEQLALRVSGNAPSGLDGSGPRVHSAVSFATLLSQIRSAPQSMPGHVAGSPARALIEFMQASPASAAAPRGGADAEIALQLWRNGSRATALWWYSPAHLDRDAVRHVADSFAVLLRALARDPDRPVGMLPLVTPAERRRLLSAGDGGVLAVPQREDFVRLFTKRVADRPGAPALAQDEQTYTRADVDTWSGRIASMLREHEGDAAPRVGLAVRTGSELPVGLLGILRAGRTAVLLDPTDAEERLRAIAQDAQLSLVYTTDEHAQRLSALGLRTALLAYDPSAQCAAVNAPEDRRSPDDVAYVVYTSGTTGVPKGVPVTHRQLHNFLYTTQHDYALTEDDVLLALARPTFGITIFENLWPLAAGASVRYLGSARGFDAERICDALRRTTALHAVPATLKVILEVLRTRQRRGERYDHLRHVYVGGDRVSRALLGELCSMLPQARVYAQYGCTEATHLSLRYRVHADRLPDRTIVGTPFRNGYVRICDDAGNVLPVGVTGEILLGGAGITGGYLGRDELTRERYLRIGRVRYYRTGDRGRYLPDGNIEFVGRGDEQVKVRGMRVELGEIEAALAGTPGLAAAAVVLSEEGQLVACCVRVPDAKVDEAELRALLARRLPDYMVPSRFVFMAELPVNTNRKVDRRALASGAARAPVAAPDAVAPATALQQALANIWQEVLGLEGVGPADNFLDLGGDSLKATLVTNRLQERLGEIVHVVALLDAPTLEGLAAYLEQHYPDAVARWTGMQLQARAACGSATRVDGAKISALRALIPPPAPSDPARVRNARAMFVLSPPRSGSTLLRVMLGGHPRLFAPPELDLLSFATLPERRATLSGKYYFWLEGTVHAIMAIKGCTAEAARALMDDCERRGLTTQAFYALLQEWLGERMLIDKTPYYGLSPAILERAERDFSEPLYIHLVRDPRGMVRSFEEGRFDLVFFSKNKVAPSFPRRELGEMVWTLTHQNILAFLDGVPPARCLRVHYEDLVTDPRRTSERLCRLAGIPFDEAMLDPYADSQARMTDGIHPESKMLGDVKFHSHRGIDPRGADRWRRAGEEAGLGDVTWALAEFFGYERATRAEGAA